MKIKDSSSISLSPRRNPIDKLSQDRKTVCFQIAASLAANAPSHIPRDASPGIVELSEPPSTFAIIVFGCPASTLRAGRCCVDSAPVLDIAPNADPPRDQNLGRLGTAGRTCHPKHHAVT